MEKRINIAELLKDCPQGMELYSPIFGTVYFDGVRDTGYAVLIDVKTSNNTQYQFYTDGKFNTYYTESEMTLFPSKDVRTWEGFQRPFKDGDILVGRANQPFIFQSFNDDNGCSSYCGITGNQKFCLHDDDWTFADSLRFATEEEKQNLFKAIKANGYKWNAETKTLEKLVEPKFHKGDWVTDGVNKYQIHFIDDTYYWYSEDYILGIIESVDKQYHLWTINDATNGDVLFHSDSASNGIFIFKEISQRGSLQKVICYCDYDSEDGFCLGENHTCCWADSKILRLATKKQRDILFQKMKEAGYTWNTETKTLEKLAEPKFKVGDKIRQKNQNEVCLISEVWDSYYLFEEKNIPLPFSAQDDWKLVPNKFDLSTLVPFESKVLVRDYADEKWCPAIWGFYDYDEDDEIHYTVVSGKSYMFCIPYESNEHLLGTTDECDDFYNTWFEG